METELEWDEEKSRANRKKRGFGFEIVKDFDWNLSSPVELQWVEGEEREVRVGPIGSALYVVVTTERPNALRIISLRKAMREEKRRWREDMSDG